MGKRLTQEEAEQRVSKFFEQDVVLISKYISKREPVELLCKDCGHKWSTSAQTVMYAGSNAYTHHCPNCGMHARKRIKLTCACCGKEIERYPSDIEKNTSGYYYCSRECGNRHKNELRKQSGEWDNGSTNYRSRALETYEHKCLCCGWDEDERILEAHHVDEDRSNNKLSNLCLLCPTCHRKITLGYYKLDLPNKKLVEVVPL